MIQPVESRWLAAEWHRWCPARILLCRCVQVCAQMCRHALYAELNNLVPACAYIQQQDVSHWHRPTGSSGVGAGNIAAAVRMCAGLQRPGWHGTTPHVVDRRIVPTGPPRGARVGPTGPLGGTGLAEHLLRPLMLRTVLPSFLVERLLQAACHLLIRHACEHSRRAAACQVCHLWAVLSALVWPARPQLPNHCGFRPPVASNAAMHCKDKAKAKQSLDKQLQLAWQAQTLSAQHGICSHANQLDAHVLLSQQASSLQKTYAQCCSMPCMQHCDSSRSPVVTICQHAN